MSTINPNSVFRYVVPFYFGDAKTDFSKSDSDQLSCSLDSSDLHSADHVSSEKEDAKADSSESNYDQFCRSLDSSDLWSVDSISPEKYDVFDYICCSVMKSAGGTGIGRGWNYASKNKKLMFRYAADPKKEEYLYWQIAKAGIYVFRTNIGLIWYEIEPSKKQTEPISLADFKLFQNRFKELGRKDTCFEEFVPKTSYDGVDTYKPFCPGEWISELLSRFYSNCHFFNAVGRNLDRPDTALIFNYAVLDGELEEDLSRTACVLANGYTDRYRLHPSAFSDIVNPFENTCWYASKGGCGYFAANASPNGFFENALSTRIRIDYFFMYILALYQSYSLLNYLRRMSSEHSADPNKYLHLSEEGTSLGHFVAEINTFLMKGMYSSVSYIHHQNEFFEYLQKRLNIKDNIESISLGIDALVNLQRLQKDKYDALRKEAESERSAAREKRVNGALAIISLLSVFSAVNDLEYFINNCIAVLGSGTDIFKSETWGRVWQTFVSGLPWTIFQALLNIVIAVMVAVCLVILIRSCFDRPKKK